MQLWVDRQRLQRARAQLAHKKACWRQPAERLQSIQATGMAPHSTAFSPTSVPSGMTYTCASQRRALAGMGTNYSAHPSMGTLAVTKHGCATGLHDVVVWGDISTTLSLSAHLKRRWFLLFPQPCEGCFQIVGKRAPLFLRFFD